MRLFVAIYPPPDALDDLAREIAGLAVIRAGARVIGRPLWHVTLAFLGEVPDRKVPAAVQAVDHAAMSLAGPPALRIAGGGRFGRGRFTVVWAGVTGPLEATSRTLRAQLRRCRVSYDRKPLRPHVTLARPGDRVAADAVRADLAALRDYEGPQWTLKALHLVRSHQGPQVRHEPLHTVALPPS